MPLDERVKYSGKIVLLGCGCVGKTVLSVMFKLIDVPYRNVIILDKVEPRKEHSVEECLSKGVSLHVIEISRQNYDEVFSKFLTSGDILVDLAYNMGCIDELEWCCRNNVLFINSALYDWESIDSSGNFEDLVEDVGCFFTESYQQHKTVKRINKQTDHKGPTAVLTHGANPGLVSHFMKVGIRDIAKQILAGKGKQQTERNEKLAEALKLGDYARMAQLEGVRLVQISESDTQIAHAQIAIGEQAPFVCSWNIPSFCEESAASAEFPCGTHETRFPPEVSFRGQRPDECSYLILPRRAMNVLTKSYIPNEGEILGCTPHHEETITISEYLSLRDSKDIVNDVGKLLYRPTVYFCYKPMPLACQSLREFASNSFRMPSQQLIANDEIIDGSDSLGVFLGGHDFKGWWCGSLLSIQQTRQITPHNNATSLQVGIAVVSAMIWAIQHPREGIHFPETLPSEEILSIVKPFLGTFVSQPIDWCPLKKEHLGSNGDDSVTEDDIWQFSNFYVEGNL